MSSDSSLECLIFLKHVYLAIPYVKHVVLEVCLASSTHVGRARIAEFKNSPEQVWALLIDWLHLVEDV